MIQVWLFLPLPIKHMQMGPIGALVYMDTNIHAIEAYLVPGEAQ